MSCIFILHLIFYCLCFCPSRFRNDAFYYIFWTQGARSHYQRRAGHVGHCGSCQKSSSAGRGGQLAASGMEASKPKSSYVYLAVYLAPASETVVNYLGNCKLGLALSLLEVLALPSYLQVVQISLYVILCGRLKTSA